MDVTAALLDDPAILSVASSPISEAPRGEPPSFFLYGEAPHAAAPGFLHLEPLDTRSRPAAWSIRLHRHLDLHHIFLMTSGGGRILTAGEDLPFAAPCLLFIPAGVAHGFTYRRESTGQVLTIASGFLEARPACAEVRATLFRRIRVLGCGDVAVALQDAFAGLARELGWTAPGHDAAVEASILQAFVLAVRAEAATRAGPSRDEALLARFRELVEARFREHPSLQDFAHSLGVSLSRLHQACRTVAGATPLGLLNARLLLEAKRALLYSDMSVAALSANLGFEDPAYFSRFFSRHGGMSPRAFRQAEHPGQTDRHAQASAAAQRS